MTAARPDQVRRWSWRRRGGALWLGGSGRPESAYLLGRTDHGIVCDHAYLVASGPLRLVERTVRCSQEVGNLTPRAGVPGRAERSHTNGYRHPDVLPVREIAHVQRPDCYVLTDSVRDAVGIQRVRVWEKERELLAAKPADQVIVPQEDLEGPGNCLQRPVAGQMAESIVDLFKVVDVHQRQREWGAGPHGPGDLRRRLPLPGSRVEQAGLGINAGRGHQLGVTEGALEQDNKRDRENDDRQADGNGEGDQDRHAQLGHIVLKGLAA